MSAPTGEVLRAADAVLGRIVGGAYPAGLRLPAETDLSAELGVSRATLREALRYLTSVGVVRSRRGSGAMVLDFRREGTLALLPAYVAAGKFDRPLPVMIRELLRMRKFLAVEAARLSAMYATPESLAPAKKLVPALADLRDPLALAKAELEMFRALVHASEMWPAVWLGNAFWGPVREIHERFAGAVGVVPTGYAAMLDELFRRIERHDADGASALLAAHFDEVDGAIAARLDALLPGQEKTP